MPISCCGARRRITVYLPVQITFRTRWRSSGSGRAAEGRWAGASWSEGSSTRPAATPSKHPEESGRFGEGRAARAAYNKSGVAAPAPATKPMRKPQRTPMPTMRMAMALSHSCAASTSISCHPTQDGLFLVTTRMKRMFSRGLSGPNSSTWPSTV